MIKIRKHKNDMKSFDFEFVDDEKKLKIMFAPNLDLYMLLGTNEILPMDANVSLFFDITKENMEIFTLFDSLYKDVITGNVFPDSDLSTRDYTKSYEYKILLDENQNINWISDDGPIEAEDRMQIVKIDDDTYRLIFQRTDQKLDCGFKSPRNIAVRFRNSGSRYSPFNSVFMRMYNKMQDIDPTCHQIHFEEIEYAKRLSKKL